MPVFDSISSEKENDKSPEPTPQPVERNKKPTPKESEDYVTKPLENAGYRPQVSTITDADGNITEVSYGTKGSRRPDAIKLEYDENGNITKVAGIIEVKNYDIKNLNQLQNNIRKQTDKTIEHYGKDVEITEVVDLRGQHVTVQDMKNLCEKFEEKNPDVSWDYRY